MYSSTAQGLAQDYVYVVDDHIIVEDVVLVSIPSTMRPGANSVVLAIERAPETLQML